MFADIGPIPAPDSVWSFTQLYQDQHFPLPWGVYIIWEVLAFSETQKWHPNTFAKNVTDLHRKHPPHVASAISQNEPKGNSYSRTFYTLCIKTRKG